MMNKLRTPVFALVVLIISCFCTASLPQGHTSRRIALVIGNASYPSAPLKNTKNDARAMADLLEKLDFDVTTILDGTKTQITDFISRLAEKIDNNTSVVLLYYAGHGVQLENRNYIIPVNAMLSTRSDIQVQAVDVAKAMAALRTSGAATNIIILDSCRDNPFSSLGSGSGLTQMDALAGTFVAFATAPGHVASDGLASDTNGVYTAALINELTNPSGAIESIFKRVRFKVRQRTGGKQIPWESSSLEKEFYFTEPRSGQVPDPIDAFKQELIQWNLIAESKDVKVFYEFIDKYPFGLFSEKAQAKIERFSSSSAVRPIGTQAFSVVPAGRPLYNIGDRFVYRSVDVNGKPQSNRDLLVTAITASTVELNGGQEVWDWTGNLITSGVNPRITRVPAKLWIPAELYIGKKWRTAYTATSKEGASTLFWDFFVESLEKLNISAGAFQAYRVTGTSVVSNGATQTETLWIDASTFLIVKDIWQRQRSIRGEERIEASYNQELTQVFKAQTR